jgi:predicted metalloprotease with PDZ domain
MFRSLLLVLICSTFAVAIEPNRQVTTAQRQEYQQTYYRGGRQPIIYFGVRSTLTDRGCRIDSVQVNSPAWIAGLEVGDYITAVDGFQVGLIDDLSFPLHSEIRRASKSNGLKIDGIDRSDRSKFSFTIRWDE